MEEYRIGMQSSRIIGRIVHICAWTLFGGLLFLVYKHAQLLGSVSFLDKLQWLIIDITGLLVFTWFYLEIVPNTLVVLDEDGVRQRTFPKHSVRWDAVTAVKLYAFSAELYANKQKVIVYLVLFDDYQCVVQLIKRHIPPSLIS
jgi:hypothetical protein